jgi:RNA polymerase sigma-70 factor (family 1)
MLSEQILIKRLEESSQEAFSQIYDLYAPRLMAYCMQYAKVSEDAEEIVEDVFVQLWNSRRNIRQHESLKGLLFTIARNRLINAFRSRINSPVYEEFVDYKDSISASDASVPLEYDDFVRRLNSALDTLPDTQRRAIKLSRIDGLTNKEIAAAMQLSEQTVKNQLSVGLKTLRQKLGTTAYILALIAWDIANINN